MALYAMKSRVSIRRVGFRQYDGLPRDLERVALI